MLEKAKNQTCKRLLMKDSVIVYNLMTRKDLVAINAMIRGHSQIGEDEEALVHKQSMEFDHAVLLAVLNAISALEAFVFCKLIHALFVKSGYQADSFVLNSLVDSYGKCSEVVLGAARTFDECPTTDLPSYTSTMTTYAQCGQGEEAMKLYLKLLDMDLKPDSFVCSSLLNACASLSAYEQGKQINPCSRLKAGVYVGCFCWEFPCKHVCQVWKCGGCCQCIRQGSRENCRFVVCNDWWARATWSY